jgi:hypothetical protein
MLESGGRSVDVHFRMQRSVLQVRGADAGRPTAQLRLGASVYGRRFRLELVQPFFRDGVVRFKTTVSFGMCRRGGP